MFNFIQDIGNYDDRKVSEPYHKDRLFVSTAKVSDGSKPYETAVAHPRYNGGDLVIVEAYSSKAAADLGHKKWIKKMSGKRLPKKLVDCANSEISSFSKAIGCEMIFPLTPLAGDCRSS